MDEPGASTERELTEPVALCTPRGRLDPDAVGWARQPIIDCNIPGPSGRRKRWDFWNVVGPGFAMNLTYADVDYLGMADVWFHDFASGETATCTVPVPLGRDFELQPRAGEGGVTYHGPTLLVRFEDDADGTRLRAAFDTPAGPLVADVVVDRPVGHESLTVVIPWSERRFQCTTKDVSRPATGSVSWGDRSYALDDDGRSWGCLDFGRGKWPYRMRWNWGAGAGVVDGRRIGIQVGGKWTAGTGMTENALVVDGRLSKISEELVWEYDTSDWLAPWHIRTPDSDRVDLTFTPVYDKVSRLQAGVAANAVDQCFGTWAGTIRPDEGGVLEVSDIFGWAEEASWRW